MAHTYNKNIHTHTQTEWRLYDQVGENCKQTVVTEKNSEKEKKWNRRKKM